MSIPRRHFDQLTLSSLYTAAFGNNELKNEKEKENSQNISANNVRASILPTSYRILFQANHLSFPSHPVFIGISGWMIVEKSILSLCVAYRLYNILSGNELVLYSGSAVAGSSDTFGTFETIFSSNPPHRIMSLEKRFGVTLRRTKTRSKSRELAATKPGINSSAVGDDSIGTSFGTSVASVSVIIEETKEIEMMPLPAPSSAHQTFTANGPQLEEVHTNSSVTSSTRHSESSTSIHRVLLNLDLVSVIGLDTCTQPDVLSELIDRTISQYLSSLSFWTYGDMMQYVRVLYLSPALWIYSLLAFLLSIYNIFRFLRREINADGVIPFQVIEIIQNYVIYSTLIYFILSLFYSVIIGIAHGYVVWRHSKRPVAMTVNQHILPTRLQSFLLTEFFLKFISFDCTVKKLEMNSSSSVIHEI